MAINKVLNPMTENFSNSILSPNLLFLDNLLCTIESAPFIYILSFPLSLITTDILFLSELN